MTDHDALVRIEMDRSDPDSWRLLRLPGAWLPSADYRHAILGAGDRAMLVRSSQVPQEATVLIVDATDGRILSTNVLPGATLPSVFARR